MVGETGSWHSRTVRPLVSSFILRMGRDYHFIVWMGIRPILLMKSIWPSWTTSIVRVQWCSSVAAWRGKNQRLTT